MANFYTEVPELKYHLNNSMMERICELKERGYQDKDKYDYCLLYTSRQREISINIRNCSIAVGTYFHDRSTDNGFTTRFFNDSTFYLNLLGKGKNAHKKKHN